MEQALNLCWLGDAPRFFPRVPTNTSFPCLIFDLALSFSYYTPSLPNPPLLIQAMASRSELIQWVNDLLLLSYTKVEQCGTGT
jgi:hypothetical protein